MCTWPRPAAPNGVFFAQTPLFMDDDTRALVELVRERMRALDMPPVGVTDLTGTARALFQRLSAKAGADGSLLLRDAMRVAVEMDKVRRAHAGVVVWNARGLPPALAAPNVFIELFTPRAVFCGPGDYFDPTNPVRVVGRRDRIMLHDTPHQFEAVVACRSAIGRVSRAAGTDYIDFVLRELCADEN